jgi:hypothetical protein
MQHAFDHWRIVQVVGKQRYLFGSLLMLMLVFPLVTNEQFQRPILNAVLTLIIITGPLSLAARRNEFLIAAVLALIMWIPGWVDFLFAGTLAQWITAFGASAFFGYLGVLLFRSHLIDVSSVSSTTILAAINAYLCMGLMFAFLYVNVSLAFPGAFVGTFMDEPIRQQMEGFIYYSFVTMTTLGYGDILPKTILAGTLAYSQAVAGQLYVALTIARVVGIQVSQASISAQTKPHPADAG